MFREELLHFIWKNKLIAPEHLESTKGETIQVQHPGQHNPNAGPDFLDARIKLQDKLWAGHVELHLDSEDWYKHQHHHDASYQNVVLHVVFRHSRGPDIPTLALEGKLPMYLVRKYKQLMENSEWIPCATQFNTVKPIVVQQWLGRLGIERLERKTALLEEDLQATTNNWDETFYRTLLKGFGTKVNALPFEDLSKRLPYSILRKYQHYLLETEALLLGMAGFLDGEFEDDVEIELQQTFKHLALKHDLTPMVASSWKFSRMRPANFPTVRLAQLASFFHENHLSFTQLIERYTITDLLALFDLSASSYWDQRYKPGELTKAKRPKKLGKSTAHVLIINVVAVSCFAYGKYAGKSHLQDKAIEILENLPAESNNIVHKWSQIGRKAKNALDSQALLELKNRYCEEKKCLHCAVGNALLRKS